MHNLGTPWPANLKRLSHLSQWQPAFLKPFPHPHPLSSTPSPSGSHETIKIKPTSNQKSIGPLPWSLMSQIGVVKQSISNPDFTQKLANLPKIRCNHVFHLNHFKGFPFRPQEGESLTVYNWASVKAYHSPQDQGQGQPNATRHLLL